MNRALWREMNSLGAKRMDGIVMLTETHCYQLIVIGSNATPVTEP